MTTNDQTPDPAEQSRPAVSGDVPGDAVTATTITISQGGTRSVSAEDVTIRQGGAVLVKTGRLDMTMGGIVGAQAHSASLTASRAAGIVAGGEVALNQSAAGLLVTAGEVTMEQSAAGAIVTNSLKAESCRSVFLVAGKVTGNVKTLFGTRESLICGTALGVIAGLAMLGIAIGRRATEPDD